MRRPTRERICRCSAETGSSAALRLNSSDTCAKKKKKKRTSSNNQARPHRTTNHAHERTNARKRTAPKAREGRRKNKKTSGKQTDRNQSSGARGARRVNETLDTICRDASQRYTLHRHWYKRLGVISVAGGQAKGRRTILPKIDPEKCTPRHHTQFR